MPTANNEALNTPLTHTKDMPEEKMPSILVTGASGFIGSFIVEEALNRGYAVWAGIRASSSRAYLQDARIRFLELDFARPDMLRARLSDHTRMHGAFDYIVHCAGATKCIDSGDFERVNHQHTRTFVETLKQIGMMPRRFIFISTLSVFGPVHEHDYAPIRDADKPCPNTAYGRSKLRAEQYLQGLPDFPYIILRPTGVYGPRERDYYLMAQSIKRHVDFAAGFRRQDLTFVYVKDVVQAVFLAIGCGVVRRTYFLSDGHVYSSRTFSALICRELGSPVVLHVKCPLWLLWLMSCAAEWWAARRKTTSTLNRDKYNIMKQRNWRCDISPAIHELGYKPSYDLGHGVPETIAWYKKEGWL